MPSQCAAHGSSDGVLAISAAGIIQRCSCCERLEIRFGNAVFEIPEHDLPALAEALARMAADPAYPNEDRPHLLKVTEHAPVAFAFSEIERSDLEQLVAHVLYGTPLGFPPRPSAFA